ncbi:chloride channel protein [Leptolyngbya sp. FACHB-321]|uniref:chloride channel protein n=1 Tax=Leptolyngbya sp. FACHB-321 TaxID=2692807 RepID=UPI001685DC19|nr:chloride channel protein [Leptolyngbya sp. FACHB-321]MBD2038880.1 chloride channel protein [Leptolyngbya sp. FACHB-321]
MTASPSPNVLTPQTPPATVLSPPKPVLASTLNRLQPAPETLVLLLALVIGSGTGCAVVLFHYLIQHIHSLMLEDVMGLIVPLGFWTLACIPVLGGLLVGIMRWWLQDFGPNLSALISASQGLDSVSPLRASGKAVAASVSLGTGASLGPEGPSVEIGANIGVIVGQALQMSKERQRLLLGAGAAAGLAAGFNAPIAGVFFALEVVLGTTFATSAVSVVLLSAVVAALIAQIGLGGQPPFTLPSYEVRSPLELPLYLGLGLFASLVSIAYTQSIQRAQQFFDGRIPGMGWMSRVPMLLRPAIGGFCVGAIALQFPQILGIGYETIEAMLRDVQFSLPLLLSLLVLKLAATAISLGSGLVGGLFAPAMFLGASLGAAYGKLMALVLPLSLGSIAAPPAYAMVGMAAVLAASARAPLTAILLLFELTRDYRIILPLMAAVGLSVWLVDRLKPLDRNLSTIQSTSLANSPDHNADVLHQLLVVQAMHQTFLSLPSTMPVLKAGLALTTHQSRSALVVDASEQLIGLVTLQDIHRAISRWETYCHTHAASDRPVIDLTTQTLDDICTKDLLYAHEDERIQDALARMSARGLHQLPVVDRHNTRHIIGLLEQEKITLLCSLTLMQQSLHPYLDMGKDSADGNEMPTAELMSLPQA